MTPYTFVAAVALFTLLVVTTRTIQAKRAPENQTMVWGWNTQQFNGILLKIQHGDVLTIAWDTLSLHNLYFTSGKCMFNGGEIGLISIATTKGTYVWDTANSPTGIYYLGCSLLDHCTRGVYRKVYVCKDIDCCNLEFDKKTKKKARKRYNKRCRNQM